MSVGLPVHGTEAWLLDPVESGGAAGFGLYLHVPFCHHRCGYCDFATEAVGGLDRDQRDDMMERYVEALCADLTAQATAHAWPRVTSIFVGGGTPTLLGPEQLARILGRATAVLDVAADAEVTVECNPETASSGLFSALSAVGVTRVSMGAQSFDTGVLRTLERVHDPERTLAAVAQAREGGIAEVSLDLIYGTPGESSQAWLDGLTEVLRTRIDHISAYALSVHANTPLGRAVAAGQTPAPDGDVQRERFEQTRAVLVQAGFDHYELSNFARGEHRRSRHNLLYWRHGDYLGVGVGAHGHADGRRWWTTRSTERYLAADAAAGRKDDGAGRDAHGRLREVTTEEVLDAPARALERLLLGLRIREGLHPGDVPPIDPEVLAAAVAAGLIESTDGRLRSTESAWFLLDETVARLS
jgi:putative oxygen-independent coproporphyrinogen III oxidase